MSKKFKWKQQLQDQLLHFIISLAIVVLVAYISSLLVRDPIVPIYIGVGVSVVVCLVREFILQLPIERWWDTLLDTAFWVFGTFFGGWLFYVVFN